MELDAMMAQVLPLYTAHPKRPGVQRLIAAWRRDARSDLARMEDGLWQTIDIQPLFGRVPARHQRERRGLRRSRR